MPSANAAAFDASVDDVFGRIAGRYDVLCDLFSLGIHRLWKRRVAALIAQEPWTRMLDAAAGTGDVLLRVLRHDPSLGGREIVVSDISPAMLGIAQRRAVSLATRPDLRVEFRIVDAQAMSDIRDAGFDLFCISLGLKICDRAKVLREAMRVLRPGGRLIALEASAIVLPWLHRVYLAYMNLCMPTIGWIATGGDASAYRYLLKGIYEFPDADELAREMQAMGFVDVSFERLSLGIVAIHMARKPSAAR